MEQYDNLIGKPVIIEWDEGSEPHGAAGVFEGIKDGYACLDWGYGVFVAADNFCMYEDDARAAK